MNVGLRTLYLDVVDWKKIGDKLWEKILYRDSRSGTYARLVKVDPGFESKEPSCHRFDEIVCILQGQQINIKSGEVWDQGMVTIIPAGTLHGPFKTDEGLLSIEFRHFASRQDIEMGVQ